MDVSAGDQVKFLFIAHLQEARFNLRQPQPSGGWSPDLRRLVATTPAWVTQVVGPMSSAQRSPLLCVCMHTHILSSPYSFYNLFLYPQTFFILLFIKIYINVIILDIFFCNFHSDVHLWFICVVFSYYTIIFSTGYSIIWINPNVLIKKIKVDLASIISGRAFLGATLGIGVWVRIQEAVPLLNIAQSHHISEACWTF